MVGREAMEQTRRLWDQKGAIIVDRGDGRSSVAFVRSRRPLSLSDVSPGLVLGKVTSTVDSARWKAFAVS